ncbi:uncharacterized protein LOC9317838 [Arabidopsis lyrata subsp. lyrata]|uniref:uncharacterized protein LOC9317838 n=1 Tax=Arabidopsis lyrata subsp. lyrata TaxID=81972 RepID=UPI000A29B2AD|nr:uncharacterized protein LOC9317838 [Arabidopsis lyrata subsp. lyrata]|eukprot:XP_020885458.1 uncharacterized protein LOC9317838 [Arabidopsis lyrata subsp. lyrata]
MKKSNVFLLSILLMASLFSISHSFTLWGYGIDRVSIRGVVYCSLDGDPSAPPVSNATVYIECPGSNSTLAQAVTNAVGVFTLVINPAYTPLVNPSKCEIKANLPTNSCFIYPPGGVLRASVNDLVSISLQNLIVIATYAATTFLSSS